MHHVSSSKAGATPVVLPAPGGATRTALAPVRNAASSSGRTAWMGRTSLAPEIALPDETGAVQRFDSEPDAAAAAVPWPDGALQLFATQEAVFRAFDGRSFAAYPFEVAGDRLPGRSHAGGVRLDLGADRPELDRLAPHRVSHGGQ